MSTAASIPILENYVGGAWEMPTADTEPDSNPARPDETLAYVPRSGPGEVAAGVAAAAAAFEGWSRTPSTNRAEILSRAADLVAERREHLARTLTAEQGKTLSEAYGEVDRVVVFWKWASGLARVAQGVTSPSETEGVFAMTIRQPLGVVGLITPWNFPLYIPAWKLGSALIFGNTVVLKPAQLTPMSAKGLVEALADAGLPAGAVNLIYGPGATVGARLVSDPRVSGVSFTGSTQVGLALSAQAASAGKPVQAELGGHNAVVVMADADIERAALDTVGAAFGNAGQRCTAPRRAIVVEEVAESFTEFVVARTLRLRCGPGDDPDTDVGPLISASAVEAVLHDVHQAEREGATLAVGGVPTRPDSAPDGHFMQPTVLTGVRQDMTIAREEVFGPVLPIIVCKDADEALATAVSTRYGLSSSIYTRDLNMAMKFAFETDTGVVHVNKPPTGSDVHLPFGGLKQSGVGPKELGDALQFFTESKTVYFDLTTGAR